MILPIFANRIGSNHQSYGTKKQAVDSLQTQNYQSVDQVSNAYAVPFFGSKANVIALRKLVRYKLPDMYLGQPMLDPAVLESMQKNGVFDFTLDRLVPILKKHEKSLLPVAKTFLNMLEITSKDHPKIKIDDAIALYYPEHQKKLLQQQEPILFEELIYKACNMPKKYYDEFNELMQFTDQRMNNDRMLVPFSENTFIYKLQQAAQPIKNKNNSREIKAINTIIKEAKALFVPPSKEIKSIYGRNRAKKIEYQRRPEVVRENSRKFQYIKGIFNNSALRNNMDLIRIFNSTGDTIYGKRIVSPFKRKEFIYDLKQITKFLKDDELADDLIRTARKIPTSSENISAFIVKHYGDSRDKIGYYFLKESVASVEHVLPKINGGKNRLANYGLCCRYINAKRSNIPFDDWVRQNPAIYTNCQKYFKRLIELYNNGTFKKLGLDRTYITDLAKTIYKQSPSEKPIIIDLSGLKKH